MNNKEIEKAANRKIKKTLYESNEIKYEEIDKIIMNKSHLVFVFDFDRCDKEEDNRYVVYVEEKINNYDNYITHLNTNSFVISIKNVKKWYMRKIEQYRNEGTLFGSILNPTFFSFKCYESEINEEIKIRKGGEIEFNNADGLINHIKIMEMKRTEEEIQKGEEKENISMNKIDRYSMMVISKYLKYTNDYINIEKSCKEYNGIIEQFKYNPIPLKNEKERELFKNIETYHIYGKGNVEKDFLKNDSKIKKWVYWNASYSLWKKNRAENEIKGVELRKEDMKVYLKEHEKDWTEKGAQTKNYSLEEGITSIGDDCFKECSNMRTISIPTTVTSIGNFSFYRCSNLESITIPSSVSQIGNDCFLGCSQLNNVQLPDNMKEIDIFTWGLRLSMRSINVPTSVTSLRKCSFQNCYHLTSITIPTGIQFFGEHCFDICVELREITVPNSVTSLGFFCFGFCSRLLTVSLPSTLVDIDNACFSNCHALNTINIPNSVTRIGGYCFDECHSLRTIEIPLGVISIGRCCFAHCQTLSTINISSTVLSIGENCFFDCEDFSIEIDPKNPVYYAKGNEVKRKNVCLLQ